MGDFAPLKKSPGTRPPLGTDLGKTCGSSSPSVGSQSGLQGDYGLHLHSQTLPGANKPKPDLTSTHHHLHDRRCEMGSSSSRDTPTFSTPKRPFVTSTPSVWATIPRSERARASGPQSVCQRRTFGRTNLWQLFALHYLIVRSSRSSRRLQASRSGLNPSRSTLAKSRSNSKPSPFITTSS